MKSFWNDHDRREIVERLRKVDPARPPRWGRMDAAKIICHLGDQLKLAYAQLECEAPAGPLRFWPVNVLMISVIPWPKGAPSPKEAWTTAPATWEQDVVELKKLIDAFGQRQPGGDWPQHPLFGKMSASMWGRLSYRHFDHHLRQLGV